MENITEAAIPETSTAPTYEQATEDDIADAMLAGWDDEDPEQTSEEEPKAEEVVDNGPEKEEADQPAEVEAEQTEEETENKEEQKNEPADQQFELKHLDEVKTVGRDEVISLAQKGMDYDRVKQKLADKGDATKEHYEFLKELADEAGMSIEQFMDNARANVLINKAKEQGKDLDMEDALNRVKLAQIERREKKADEERIEKAKTEALENEKRTATLLKFSKEHPGVKGEDVPKDVWDAFFKGEGDLSDLYTAKVLYPQMQKKLADMEQAEKNRKASVGSKKTAGKGTFHDPDFDGWDD